MYKPSSLTLKETLIKKLAIKFRISESIIETVVDEQFKGVIKAMETNTSVELSGFGTFHLLPSRTKRVLSGMYKNKEMLENGQVPPKYPGLTLEEVNKQIKNLENKLNVCQGNN